MVVAVGGGSLEAGAADWRGAEVEAGAGAEGLKVREESLMDMAAKKGGGWVLESG